MTKYDPFAIYRVFDGKKYTFAANYGSKAGADKSVKDERKAGNLARMTKYLDKVSKKYRYEVWVRGDK